MLNGSVPQLVQKANIFFWTLLHTNDKWPFFNHFKPIFAIYINIFHKTEVQTVISTLFISSFWCYIMIHNTSGLDSYNLVKYILDRFIFLSSLLTPTSSPYFHQPGGLIAYCLLSVLSGLSVLNFESCPI